MIIGTDTRLRAFVRLALTAVGLVVATLMHLEACLPAERQLPDRTTGATPSTASNSSSNAPAGSGANSTANSAAGARPSAESLSAGAGASWLEQLDLKALWLENTWREWALLAAAVLAGIAVGRLAALVVRRAAQRMAQRGWQAQAHFVESSAAPISLVLMTVGLWVGLAGLKMSQPMQLFWQKTFLMLYTLAVLLYGWNLAGLLDIVVARLTHRPESVIERQLVPILRKTVRVLLLVLAALFLLESVFHQNIGAWLAGLGIAGLAVSLAAQDSLKNLFGSLTILLDRPFSVGDRIATSGYEGVVEEIGFRSTRIRTLNDTLVTIPNANIVNSPVENIARRRFIRRAWNIALPGDMPAARVQQAVEVIRGVLAEPGVGEPINSVIDGKPISPLVYCSDLNPGQTVISIVYCYAPADFAAYWQHAEKVNLRIAAALQEAQIPFNPLLLRYRAD
jgi:MscS family membrane protein